MSTVHRVHPSHMGTWDKIFMSLSLVEQEEYEKRLDRIFEQIKENSLKPVPPESLSGKNPERSG